MTLSTRIHAAGLLSTTDVAERMGVHRSTVWLWIRNGAMEAKKIGGFLGIEVAEFEKLSSRYVVSPAASSSSQKKAKRRGKSAAKKPRKKGK